MRRYRTFLSILAMVLTLIAGCERRNKERSVFQQEACAFVLLIAVSDDVVANDDAYLFILKTIDKYFQDRIGTADQVIVARIEAERPLVWQGTPRTLRQKFPNAAEFRRHLTGPKAPGSLHDGLTRSFGLLMETYSIKKGNAKAVTMILSDMNDDQPSTEANERFIDALVSYCKRGGQLAIYFCDQLRFEEIRAQTKKAGFDWVTLELDVHGDPPLPSFE